MCSGKCYPSVSVTAKRCRDYAVTAPGALPWLGVSAGADVPIFSSPRRRPGSGGVRCDRGIPLFSGMTGKKCGMTTLTTGTFH
jgi:hypothetical protein